MVEKKNKIKFVRLVFETMKCGMMHDVMQKDRHILFIEGLIKAILVNIITESFLGQDNSLSKTKSRDIPTNRNKLIPFLTN